MPSENKWQLRLGQQSQANFYNASMLSLYLPILLMNMRIEMMEKNVSLLQ